MDIVKVVLHSLTYEQAHTLYVQSQGKKLTLEELILADDFDMDGVRLTLVGILDREELRIGLSICNTKTDNFVKSVGVTNATIRALTSPIVILPGGELDKFMVLDILKHYHMEVGNNLKKYKKLVHGS